MIPIIWFLVAWLATVGVFFLLAFMTIGIALRFGLSGSKTKVLCTVFLIVPVIIVATVGVYSFVNVDWTQSINLIPSPSGSAYLLP